MKSSRQRIEQPRGLTFPLIGGRYWVFRDGRNALTSYGTMEEAQDAAALHFDKKRKKNP